MQTTLENLTKIREENRNKKIVFCSGSFDLVHAGHILFLEDCKKLGDVLVVGVAGDAIIKKNKGDKRPILNEFIRMKTIDSLRQADYTFLNNSKYHNEGLLSAIETVLDKLKPNFYTINEDAFDIPYRKKLCSKYGTNLVILKRNCPSEFDNISTTKIIEKIRDLYK